ncbi:MAG: NADH-ubiquinone oxidoreductase-F iron-sulfur binding region domain-containing protein [Lapillicoccus sp.]
MHANPVMVRRLLGATAASLTEHLDQVGPLPVTSPAALRTAVAESGLVGCGGAGFPTGRKLAAVAAGGRAVVVANGAEGEPASAKDRYLLSAAPHLVLDGVQAAVAATGAAEAFLYAPAEALNGSLGAAVRERSDPVPVRPVVAPHAFLSGEESAAVAAVHGRRAVPFTTPPRVFEAGVGGRPTLVQNVETLAHLGLIARFGPQWFRSVGTAEAPGTRLVTVSGAVGHPGVYEVAGGSALTEVLTTAGGLTGSVTAVLVGGYHGGWVPSGDLRPNLQLTRAALAPYDAAPGAGVVVALPSSACGLQAGADITAYLAGQGARQCGPCRNGLPAVASSLRTLAYGQPTRSMASEVARLSALVDGRGACHHPAGTVRLVRSTLRAFEAEVSLHLQGRCSAVRTAVRERWAG